MKFLTDIVTITTFDYGFPTNILEFQTLLSHDKLSANMS